MKRVEKLLIGLMFIALGIVFGLNALNIVQVNIFFDGWWTLFIIIPSLLGLFKDNDKTSDLIGLVIGIVLLLACQGLLDFDLIWKLMLPAILVMIGLSIIFKDVIAGYGQKKIKDFDKKRASQNDYSVAFGNRRVLVNPGVFEGARIDVSFGSMILDLRNATIADNAYINASVTFGNLNIYLPENVNVKVNSTNLFGSVDNKRVNAFVGSSDLYVESTVMFGGIDLK